MTPDRRLKNAIKCVRHQWGHGWQKLSPCLQEALVRAEVLAEIGRLDGAGTDAAAYRDLVEALTALAMQWSPDELGN